MSEGLQQKQAHIPPCLFYPDTTAPRLLLLCPLRWLSAYMAHLFQANVSSVAVETDEPQTALNGHCSPLIKAHGCLHFSAQLAHVQRRKAPVTGFYNRH